MAGHDVVVVGSGPNGLSAAVAMARAGRSVLVLEAEETIGGAARTMELTLPGFAHDAFSSVYPLGIGSPFFRSLPLRTRLTWLHPPAPRRTRSTTAAAVWRVRPRHGETLGAEEGVHKRVAAVRLAECCRLLAARYHAPPAADGASGWTRCRSLQGLVEAPFARARACAAARAPRTGAASTYARRLVRACAGGGGTRWDGLRARARARDAALASLLRSLGGDPDRRARPLATTPPTTARWTCPRRSPPISAEVPGRYRRALSGSGWFGVFKWTGTLDTVPGLAAWRRGSAPCLTPAAIYASEREPISGRVSGARSCCSRSERLDPRSRPVEARGWGYCQSPLSDADMTA